MGRFTMAAKYHQNIAEIFETDGMDLEQAVQHYEQAADYFRGEESNSSANKCLLKVAQYAAQLENYDKAIQIYQQVRCISVYMFGCHGSYIMLIPYDRWLRPHWKVLYLNIVLKNISSVLLCVSCV